MADECVLFRPATILYNSSMYYSLVEINYGHPSSVVLSFIRLDSNSSRFFRDMVNILAAQRKREKDAMMKGIANFGKPGTEDKTRWGIHRHGMCGKLFYCLPQIFRVRELSQERVSQVIFIPLPKPVKFTPPQQVAAAALGSSLFVLLYCLEYCKVIHLLIALLLENKEFDTISSTDCTCSSRKRLFIDRPGKLPFPRAPWRRDNPK